MLGRKSVLWWFGLNCKYWILSLWCISWCNIFWSICLKQMHRSQVFNILWLACYLALVELFCFAALRRFILRILIYWNWLNVKGVQLFNKLFIQEIFVNAQFEFFCLWWSILQIELVFNSWVLFEFSEELFLSLIHFFNFSIWTYVWERL